jgi:hypothetical protein
MEVVDRKACRPVEYPGLVRIGRADSDGGYVIPEDLIRGTNVLVSLGLGDDWSFDEDFLRRNPRARLIGVDHTVNPWFLTRLRVESAFKVPAYTLLGNQAKVAKWTERLQRARSYRGFFAPPNQHIIKRVASGDSGSDISLGAILAMTPASGAPDVFVKMDIEGSEYEVVPAIVAGSSRINGLAVEFHHLDKDAARFNAACARLREHFHIVHVHASDPNPYDEANGFPAAVEITFVNRSLFRTTPRASEVAYPRPGLDVSRDPAKAQRALRFD